MESVSPRHQNNKNAANGMSNTFEPAKFLDLFRRLDQCLEEFDPVESEKCVKKIKSCLSPNDPVAQFEIMENQIANFNFSSASETLKKLISMLEISLT
jgi:hypothetical protein